MLLIISLIVWSKKARTVVKWIKNLNEDFKNPAKTGFYLITLLCRICDNIYVDADVNGKRSLPYHTKI